MSEICLFCDQDGLTFGVSYTLCIGKNNHKKSFFHKKNSPTYIPYFFEHVTSNIYICLVNTKFMYS